ncbi:hypothetical protein STVIR_8714 [Streptomyces viridochromogenes Tue57]|uniref:Integral membrane protein n=1 Tax=Streptomyces viridochromogenes Tue57 TaxID=1160705 RepID=L8P1H0_STRVR|nr:hypothetical protein STVIR_8714 [Streptomyces viridochromogenes Tue57]
MRRRPLPRLRHSAGLRQLVLPLVVTDLVMAFVLSSMLPPAARPAHAGPAALLVLAGLGLVAATLRHPHEVNAERVVLRTGFLGDVSVYASPNSLPALSGALRTAPPR